MQYRWTTNVLCGQWRRTEKGALLDALRAGQAEKPDEEIALHEFVRIEQQGQNLTETAYGLKLAA